MRRSPLLARAGSRSPPASCEHWDGEPDSLELTWGAARRFQLTPHVGGPDVAAALDGLLARWRGHLAACQAPTTTTAPRSSPGRAATSRASRSCCAAASRRWRHRRAPRPRPTPARPAAMAAADAAAACDQAGGPGRYRRGRPPRAGGDRVRRALRRGDRAAAHGRALRALLPALLAEPEPWTWLAERDGTAIGLLHRRATRGRGLDRADDAAGAGRLPADRSSAPAERGAASAPRWRAPAPRRHAAGVAVTLLHYEQVNPLSAPFWSQQGYRPLWTVLGGQACRRRCAAADRCRPTAGNRVSLVPVLAPSAGSCWSLSRPIWKNDDRRKTRATSIMTSRAR